MQESDKIKAYLTSWGNGNVAPVVKLIETAPELKPLINTPQSRSVHAEGSCARHTIMVCEAINEVIETVPGSSRRVLRFAALLHDIGKPNCIIEAAPGIYSFPEVQKVSFKQARIFLDKYAQIPVKERELILALINNHPEPLKLVKKGMPMRELRRISMECSLELLFYLVKANYIGRNSPNLRQKFEDLESFKMWCVNKSLWGNKQWKGLLTLHSLQRFGKNAEVVKNTIDWFYLNGLIEDQMHAQDWFIEYNTWQWGTLYLTVGPPGSGKSTWIKENYSILPVVSTDAIRVELCGNMADQSKNEEVLNIAEKRIKNYLENGQQVVFDSTNLNFAKRKRMIDLARSLGAHVVVIFFTTSYDTCINRVKSRPTLPLPKDVIDEMYNDFDYVSSYEYDKLIYI